MPISIGGQTYDDQQIKQFYAGGGDDNQFLQQAGISDPWARRDLAIQARGIAGPESTTGDAALQQQFKRYQQYNPQGANVNNYAGYVNDLGTHTSNAIRAGAYTGAAIDSKDFDFGGIYGPGSAAGNSAAAYGQPGYGMGPRGMGGSWDGAPGGGGGSSSGGGGGGYGGGANLGMGGGQGAQSQQGGYGGGYGGGQYGGPNPYMSAMADDIARRSDKNLGMGLQAIQSNAIASGGIGGSRQGVAQGIAIGNANDTLQGNLANLYGTDFNNQQNRNVQAYGIDKGAATSVYGINTNAALTNQGQNQNFYTQQRQLDQSGLALGANLYNQGNAGYLNQGAGIGAIGTTQQQAPWGANNNASNLYQNYSGLGGTQTGNGSSYQPGSIGQAVGGGIGGYQLGKNFGLSGTSGSSSGGWGNTNGSLGSWGATANSDPYNIGQGTSYNGNYGRM